MGISPKTPPTITITTEIFSKNPEDLDSTFSDMTRHVFGDLGGIEAIDSVKGDKMIDLQDFLDQKGAPQNIKEANALSTARGRQKKEFSNSESTSNPTVTSENAMSAYEKTGVDLPGFTTEMAMPSDISRPPYCTRTKILLLCPHHTEIPSANSHLAPAHGTPIMGKEELTVLAFLATTVLATFRMCHTSLHVGEEQATTLLGTFTLATTHHHLPINDHELAKTAHHSHSGDNGAPPMISALSFWL